MSAPRLDTPAHRMYVPAGEDTIFKFAQRMEQYKQRIWLENQLQRYRERRNAT